MKHQYALKIESPCSENWNEMLSSDKGKFCLHCQKTVIDFSEMADYEIAMYLHQHKNEIFCGRVKVAQTEKPFLFVEPQLTSSPVKRYVMAMLAALALVSPNMANSSPLPIYSLVQTDTQTEKPPIKDSTVLNSISGILTDKETGKPIAYATVVLSVNLLYNMEAYKKMHKEAYLLEVERKDKAKAEEIRQEIKDIELKNNLLYSIGEELRKTPIFCKTDKNGYFYLALPAHFKKTDVCLNIRLLNQEIKDSEGKEERWTTRKVNPLLIHYKGGHYYKDMAVQIEQKEIEFIIGIMSSHIPPPTDIND